MKKNMNNVDPKVYQQLVRRAITAWFFLLALVLFTTSMAQNNTFTGRVILDRDFSGTVSTGDIPQVAVRVHLYEDLNGNGNIDPNDIYLNTAFTNGDGYYTVSQPFGGGQPLGIVQGNDDAEEVLNTGQVRRGDNQITLGVNGNNGPQLVGLRFQGLPAINGATVTNAFLTMTARRTRSGNTNLQISAELTPNAAAISGNNGDLSARTRTASTINWNNVQAFSQNSDYNSPDLSAVIQEIINQPTWASGNAILLMLEGSGRRDIYSYNDDPNRAVTLTVSYQTGSVSYIAILETADLNPGAILTSPGSYSVAHSSGGNTVNQLDFAYQGESVGCYAQADNGDNLWGINRFSGANSVLAHVPAGGIEAMTFSFDRSGLYSPDGSRLGLTDRISGGWTPSPNNFGSGNGVYGTLTFNDIDGLYSDILNLQLFGTLRRSGSRDVLIRINPLDGRIVPNAFGIGQDYVPISGLGIFNDIDDVAINPQTGIMYGINNNGSTYQLIQIDKLTGNAIVIGPTGVSDIEGLGFSENGELYGTTGTNSNTDNSFFHISKVSGVATYIGTFNADSDYEACECRDNPPIIILPVSLVNFSARSENEDVILEWYTETETGASHFEIERSFDAVNYEKVGEINAYGTSTTLRKYGHVDARPGTGLIHYRLRLVDRDGAVNYSESRRAFIGTYVSDALEITSWPNPATDWIEVHAEGEFTQSELTIMTTGGQQAIAPRTVNAGETTRINVQDLPAGMYLVSLKTDRGIRATKLIKQ